MDRNHGWGAKHKGYFLLLANWKRHFLIQGIGLWWLPMQPNLYSLLRTLVQTVKLVAIRSIVLDW